MSSPAELDARAARAASLGALLAELLVGHRYDDIIAVLTSLLASNIALVSSSEAGVRNAALVVSRRLQQFALETHHRQHQRLH